MSATETVNLTISATEIQSVSDVASIIANKIQSFANKYGVGNQYNEELTEEDMIFFLTKRKTLGLEQLEVHILDNGKVAAGSYSGRRKATLIFRINYSGGAARF